MIQQCMWNQQRLSARIVGNVFHGVRGLQIHMFTKHKEQKDFIAIDDCACVCGHTFSTIGNFASSCPSVASWLQQQFLKREDIRDSRHVRRDVVQMFAPLLPFPFLLADATMTAAQ